jgi:hypothetical protein
MFQGLQWIDHGFSRKFHSEGRSPPGLVLGTPEINKNQFWGILWVSHKNSLGTPVDNAAGAE